jgi:hypothetical protein
MVKNYGRSGWRGESYRHYLAAKGVKTTPQHTSHTYLRRKITGMPQTVPMTPPTPKPLAPVEKRILSAAMYEKLKKNPAALQEAIRLQSEINKVDIELKDLKPTYSARTRDVAIALLEQEKLIYPERTEQINAQLSGLRELRDPEDVDAGFTDDVSRYYELQQLKELNQRKLINLLGVAPIGSIYGSGRRVSAQDIRRAARAKQEVAAAATGDPTSEVEWNVWANLTPEQRSEIISPENVVLPLSPSKELILPSSPLRRKAIERVAKKEESLARTTRATPTTKDILPGSQVKKERVVVGLKKPQIPGEMDDSVTLSTEKPDSDKEDREYMSGRVLFGAGVGGV